ncbi:hypothetical protein AV530_004823 [Patagioenas fasciata monilis]|uniref:Uncharacterized protein n=1 Tax=Patagioenas fasciata monilis TaxID=372326 RepID=A0A1V4KFQ6_PATFA|nr:hypothetical protein AV530_004823 [Patagioenas fasciata monilis]
MVPEKCRGKALKEGANVSKGGTLGTVFDALSKETHKVMESRTNSDMQPSEEGRDIQHQGTLALKLNKEHLTSRLLTARCTTFNLIQVKKTYENTTPDFVILWYLLIFA